MANLSQDGWSNKSADQLDPDPVTAATFVVTAISAAAAVGALLNKVRSARLENASQRRKLKAIIRMASSVARQLVEDIEWFEDNWKPGVVIIQDTVFTVWDLTSYEHQSLKRLVRRLTSSYVKLQDIQNQIGEMKLDEIGDEWRLHSVESSTRLLRDLSSVESPEDFIALSQQIRRALSEYLNSVEQFDERSVLD